MVGKIGVRQGGESFVSARESNEDALMLNMDQLKASIEVVNQFNQIAGKAVEAGATAQNTYNSAKEFASDLGERVGAAINDLPAVTSDIHKELQRQDAADRLEKGVLAGIKGLMTFTYFSTLYVPAQVISLLVGVGVASIGGYEWSRGEETDKIWQGLSLGASPSKLLVNLIKATFIESETVTTQEVKSTFENVDKKIDEIFKVDREKASLFEKGVVVLSKGVILSGGVALAFPVSILAIIAGAASVPSGGWKRGAKIALLPAMTAAALFKSIAIDAYVMGQGVLAPAS